ncbi:MAG: LamG domain-containing protein, partial [Muribaculaceae bacterium]|nr:LamG domain-containing protein [Muribaculaceae bacterium]
YNKEINGVIDSPATTQKPNTPANIKSGLTAYFPFNGDLNDFSGNEYYGYGAPVPAFTEGITGGKKALSFTKRGKEAFVVGDGIIDTRSMTVSFWIKNISEGDIFHLTSTNHYGENNKMMRLAYRDGHLKYVVSRYRNYNSSSFSSTGNLTHMSIDDGGWHHVVIVSDYNTLKSGVVTTSLYVDGHIMDTVTEELGTYDESQESSAHFGTSTKFVLGGDNAPSMQVACLRMYSENQLDRNHIVEIYNKEINGVIDQPDNVKKPDTSANVKKGLAAYFTFNGNLDDISGNDYYGYGSPIPSFTAGVKAGTKALAFTKTGKEAFIVSEGVIDTRSMTVSFWIKDISEGDIFHLTSSNNYGSSNKMMRLAYLDGHLKYVVSRYRNYNSSSFSSTGNLTHMSIDDGEWHHVAIASDYNSLKSGVVTTSLYVDGHIMDTVTEELGTYDESQESTAHFGTGTKFVLGGDNASSMKVACLRMYDSRQLTEVDVMSLYTDKY